MEEYNLGRVAFVDKGIYNPATVYDKWDFVTTIDSTYLYISDAPQIGKTPPDFPLVWKCLADGKPSTLAAAAAAQAAIDANNAIDNVASELAAKEDKANKKSIINPLSTTEYPNSKAVADELAGKEASTNKQNSLTPDGTGTKYPTVDAVNAGLVANSNLLYQYIHSGNIEVYISAIDYVTHTFTSVGHGLENDDRLGLKIIEDGIIENIIPFTDDIPQSSSLTGYYVVNSSQDTFQISATSGGVPITTINKATQNFSKWRFEKLTTATITLPNIPAIGCEIEIIGDIMQMNRYVRENSYPALSTGYNQTSVTSAPLTHANTYLLKGWYRISVRKTESSMVVNRKYVGIRLDPANSARIKWDTGEFMMITHGNIPSIENIGLTAVMLTNGTIINVYKI